MRGQSSQKITGERGMTNLQLLTGLDAVPAVVRRVGPARAWVLVLILVAACQDMPNEDDRADDKLCGALRDHLVDLRLANATGVDLAAHRQAMKEALGGEFLTSCSGKNESPRCQMCNGGDERISGGFM
jgi:hypothetical protein